MAIAALLAAAPRRPAMLGVVAGNPRVRDSLGAGIAAVLGASRRLVAGSTAFGGL